jgi:hypothetical protein
MGAAYNLPLVGLVALRIGVRDESGGLFLGELPGRQ